MQSHIVVVDPRAIEESPRGIPECPYRIRTEELDVKSEWVVSWIVVDIQRPERRIIVGQIDTDAVDAVVLDLNQGIIPEALKGDWQAGRKARYSRNCPALRKAIGSTEQLFKRQLVVVTEDEVVFEIEGRNRVLLAEIKGIDLLLDAGSPVHGFAVRITGQQGQVPCGRP